MSRVPDARTEKTEKIQDGADIDIDPRADAATRAELTRRALATGVFGSPSYVLDGEVFWGQDRLELLDDALTSGRPPYKPF